MIKQKRGMAVVAIMSAVGSATIVFLCLLSAFSPIERWYIARFVWPVEPDPIGVPLLSIVIYGIIVPLPSGALGGFVGAKVYRSNNALFTATLGVVHGVTWLIILQGHRGFPGCALWFCISSVIGVVGAASLGAYLAGRGIHRNRTRA